MLSSLRFNKNVKHQAHTFKSFNGTLLQQQTAK